MVGFEVEKADEAAVEAFLARETLDPDITSVPGVDAEQARVLAIITPNLGACANTHQLIGRFLSLCKEGRSFDAQCDAFFYYLQAKGAHKDIHTIVRAISRKTAQLVPGVE